MVDSFSSLSELVNLLGFFFLDFVALRPAAFVTFIRFWVFVTFIRFWVFLEAGASSLPVSASGRRFFCFFFFFVVFALPRAPLPRFLRFRVVLEADEAREGVSPSLESSNRLMVSSTYVHLPMYICTPAHVHVHTCPCGGCVLVMLCESA